MFYLMTAPGHHVGQMVLRNSAVGPMMDIEWDPQQLNRLAQVVNKELHNHARALGATVAPAPLSGLFESGGGLVSLHPTGGCPIGDDYSSGTVDAYGRVYSADGAVHAGLFVWDGSTAAAGRRQSIADDLRIGRAERRAFRGTRRPYSPTIQEHRRRSSGSIA